MNGSSPAISVLIRSLGVTAMLAEALESLRRQIWRDFEVIIVEDGAATLAEFLEAYDGLFLRYLAMGERSGRSKAGNKALDLAQGEYCLFLDEDDLLHPNHLASLIEEARRTKRRIVHSWSEQRAVERSAQGTIIRTGRFRRIRRERFSVLHLAAYNYLPINCILFQRSLYEQAGGFDENLEYLEDWLLWLRYAALEPVWGTVKRPTAIYHVALNRKSYEERRSVIRSRRDYIESAMEHIQPSWSLRTISAEMNAFFRVSVFLRKCWYHLSSYVG